MWQLCPSSLEWCYSVDSDVFGKILCSHKHSVLLHGGYFLYICYCFFLSCQAILLNKKIRLVHLMTDYCEELVGGLLSVPYLSTHMYWFFSVLLQNSPWDKVRLMSLWFLTFHCSWITTISFFQTLQVSLQRLISANCLSKTKVNNITCNAYSKISEQL